MSSLALSFNEVNFTPVEQNGQVWLTASELANALGYAKSDAVGQVYERNKDEFTPSMTMTLKMSVVRKTGKVELENRIFSLRGAHLIAMFSKTAIAKQFRKWVLDVLDREVVTKQLEGRQSISPEQQALLHEIVARRSGGERKIFAEMWARHNRHFKIPRYAELLEIHFPEAIHYLETMDIKAKAEKQEVKALPYPQEVIQVAQQISQEFNNSKCDSWHVSARNGVLTAMPLPPGFYPTMDIAEFTKRFDSVLDLLYGTDTLRVGRHFLKERNSK
ncbi:MULTISPECIES: BRO family protein [unclassified Acinetobacter]|uniref:BRO-N domain-containing protein n=1 Tax=unclassified Acinetobacter TaxID=196816 RepID=UPI00211DD6D2|nr:MULTISPECIES: BRO family protein [unclassified Acinetobacter]